MFQVLRWLSLLLVFTVPLATTPAVSASNNQCDGFPYSGCGSGYCCNAVSVQAGAINIDSCSESKGCVQEPAPWYGSCDSNCQVANFPAACAVTPAVPDSYYCDGGDPDGNDYCSQADAQNRRSCNCYTPGEPWCTPYDWGSCGWQYGQVPGEDPGLCSDTPGHVCFSDDDCVGEQCHYPSEECGTCTEEEGTPRTCSVVYPTFPCCSNAGHQPPPITQVPAPPGQPTYTPFPTPTPVINSPVGAFSTASCNASTYWGWACDADNFNTPLVVNIFINGQWVAETLANATSTPLANCFVFAGLKPSAQGMEQVG